MKKALNPIKLQAKLRAETLAQQHTINNSDVINSNLYHIRDNNADCIVFLPKDEFIGDLPTLNQIKEMVNHPALVGEKIRIMPDVHRCYGCCVGLTATLSSKIEPKLISKDIGCGMVVYPLDTDFFRHRSLEKIEKMIKRVVCMGSQVWETPVIKLEEITQLFQSTQSQAYQFIRAYQDKFNVDLMPFVPTYNLEWLKAKCQQINANYDVDILKASCTLGSGNHFVEINEDLVTHERFVSVHSGSRAFGGHICDYHQNKIKVGRQFPIDVFDDKVKSLTRQYQDSKILKQEIDKVRAELDAQRHSPYLEGEEAYEYYFDMIFCQQFASLNRRLILGSILQVLDRLYLETPDLTMYNEFDSDDEEAISRNVNRLPSHQPIELSTQPLTSYFDESKIIESVHNYIDFTDLILRKGAISAHLGQLCVVALNMRDGILICEGLGNAQWNQSCAHGSGRKFSRQSAQSKLRLKDFIEDMKDVTSTSVCKDTLDECPRAYKDTSLITSLIGDTVKIQRHLKSIINLKAPN